MVTKFAKSCYNLDTLECIECAGDLYRTCKDCFKIKFMYIDEFLICNVEK